MLVCLLIINLCIFCARVCVCSPARMCSYAWSIFYLIWVFVCMVLFLLMNWLAFLECLTRRNRETFLTVLYKLYSELLLFLKHTFFNTVVLITSLLSFPCVFSQQMRRRFCRICARCKPNQILLSGFVMWFCSLSLYRCFLSFTAYCAG